MKLAFAVLVSMFCAGSAFAGLPQPPAGPYTACGEAVLLGDYWKPKKLVFRVWTRTMMTSYWEFPLTDKQQDGQTVLNSSRILKYLSEHVGSTHALRGHLIDINGVRSYLPTIIDSPSACR